MPIQAAWPFPAADWRAGPRITVRLTNPQTKASINDLTAVMDTGSPWVVAQVTHVNQLALSLSVPPEDAELRFIGAPTIKIPLRDAQIGFPGQPIPDALVRVAGFDIRAYDPAIDLIIGRELFRDRVLLYDGLNGTLVLVHDPPRVP